MNVRSLGIIALTTWVTFQDDLLSLAGEDARVNLAIRMSVLFAALTLNQLRALGYPAGLSQAVRIRRAEP